jgi:hypothetical protein
MKKFIINLFSNRFGIVLATLNLCYFLTRPFFQRLFTHNHGENCFFFKGLSIFPINLTSAENLMVLQNLPATVLSFFPRLLINEIAPNLCFYTQVKFHFVFLAFFIVLQWLFIAWIAKTIAQKLRPTEL